MVVIVRHKVRDFDAWKPVFEEHGKIRRGHGATGHVIYRDLDDPNDVIVLNSFPTKEQAEAFAADPSLKEAMERSGVVTEPQVTFAREVETIDY
jgi:hypothetical protein